MNEQQPSNPIVPKAVIPPVVQPIQQQPTQPPKPQPSNPYEALGEMEKIATELRAKWTPYSIIALSIKEQFERVYKEQTLREWFMQGGKCYAALEFLKKQRAIQREKDLKEMEVQLKETAVEALGILKRGMIGGVSKEQMQIAQDILDRSGYPKVSKIEGRQNIESDSMSELANSLKAIAQGIK